MTAVPGYSSECEAHLMGAMGNEYYMEPLVDQRSSQEE